MATSPFAGAGLGQFGQELSRPGIFDGIGDKVKKLGAIALLNGTGATGFLDNLLPGFKEGMGVPAPTVTPIKPPQITSNNFVDNANQIVSFNPYTQSNPISNLDALSDHDIGNPYLEKYKE